MEGGGPGVVKIGFTYGVISSFTGGIRSPCGPLSIVSRGLGALNCQHSGVSLRMPFKLLGLHFPILFLENYLV